MADVRSQLLICTGGGCIACGSLEVAEAARQELVGRDLAGEVGVIETGCLGPCVQGPVALVYPDGVFYQNVHVEDVPEIVEEHLLKGRIVERLVSHAPGTDRTQAEMDDIPFFNRQVKIVLRNSGIIDPLKIDEYIAREGYQALAKVLTEMTPEQVVEEVLASGLRGRGGAGFPTGMKWKFAQQQDNDVKYILCNADEGDPGAFMDRSVLEGDPHSLIEGMVIGAFAIGAHQGYVYVRAEYPLAVERLNHALGQAREYGLLGDDIMGSGFAFDLEIRMGSGAFVCGEETALMTSIEGNRGEPRPRPPFPAVSGLWGKPSVLNNVETFANIAPIILKGAAWYASTGTEQSKGTKVFALGGNVLHTGLVEVPIGMQLGELIFDVGGGIPGGKEYKAAQLGGPSGGCIPKEHLSVPVDYAPCSSSAPSWAQAASSSWTRTPAWWTSRASSSSSPRRRAAASVRPAAWAPSACSRSWSASRAVRARRATSSASWPSAPPSARPRSAASAKRRPTRCSAPSATSATSTRRTSRTSTARPASVRRCSRRGAPTRVRPASTSPAS